MVKEISLSPQLDENAIRRFEGHAVRRKFPRNTIIFSKGDESDSLYLVCKGKVKVVIEDEQGKEIVLSVMGPGEYFGEMAAVDGAPRSATVVTREPTELMIIHRSDFRNVLSSNPDVVFNLLKVLVDRLRRADEKIERLAFMNVHGRVVDFLLRMAEPQDQKWVVREKPTHQEIGNTIGCSREMVSKVLRELLRNGTISIERNRIVINRRLR
jgi:CRP/FNR family cyclic AMP-dependent transcriptional regulator